MVIQAIPNSENRISIGTTTQCRVGTGASNALGYALKVGSTSQFGFLLVITVYTKGRSLGKR